MAVLDILIYPDPRLKQTSSSVSNFDAPLRDFIADLEETMLAHPGCVGLAAPQAGRFERIVVLDVSGKPQVPNNGRLTLINPEIVHADGSAVGREGCLSVPDYTGNVARAEKIALKAFDSHGRERLYRMEGFEARAALHELDHLDGLLFLDRLVSRRNALFRRKNQGRSSAAKTGPS
ncbi:MAG: peptide deformylase [Nitrospinae bacterium]|nr:peptide deformylase [Nitrospinota bacterium]